MTGDKNKTPDRDWPSDGIEILNSCPVCSGASRSLMHTRLTDVVFKTAPGEWTMWKCSTCGSGYLDPRPSQDTIHIAYKTYYTHNKFAEQNEIGKFRPVSGLKNIRRTLANGYRNQKYGTQYKDAHWLGYWILELYPPGREMIDVQFRYLPHPESTKTARLLDVGCGDGSFLELARTAGWSVFGCDPDQAAVEGALARGVMVRAGGADAWLDEEGSFDAISLSHVLEHVPEPTTTIGMLHRLLRPGGFLYIDTPHIDALGHQLYGRNWRGLEVPRHLSIFSRKAMRRLLEDNGMDEIRFRTRKHVIKELSRKSALLKAGLSPYLENADDPLDLPSKIDIWRARFAPHRSEFLTVTCRKR